MRLVQVWLWYRESVHQDSLFSCDDCDYIGTSAASLRYHIQIEHQGLNYPCIHCDYVSKSVTFLKRRVNRKVQGPIRGGGYGGKPPWTSEIYWFQGVFRPQRLLSPPGKIKKFKLPWTNSWIRPCRKHIDVSYPCAQCDHRATSHGNLMIHVFNKQRV